MAEKKSNLPPKGTLDISPQEMRVYDYIHRAVQKVTADFHFECYQVPALESWETFAQKSSDEILEEQSYHFIDRGARKLILRPEITPSLARMVSKNLKSLTLPLKWYTIGACYRYENPQMGRLREFNQLNCDILGENHPLFDVEILRLTVALLTEWGLTEKNYLIYYNHRGIINHLLDAFGFLDAEKKDFFYLIDRKNKWEKSVLEEQIKKRLKTSQKIDFFRRFLSCQSAEEWQKIYTDSTIHDKQKKEEALVDFEKFFHFERLLEQCGIKKHCVFSPCIVRGFDYYTGIVFEVFEQSGLIRRSIFGGGRYDNLIKYYSQQQISGVGFGMGMYILSLLLQKLNLVQDDYPRKKRIMIAPLAENCVGFALKVGEQLRKNAAIEINTPAKIKNHFKRAEQKNLTHIVLVGENEVNQKNFTIRDLQSGEETKNTVQ